MVVTLPKESCLLRRDVVELDQHPLHGNVAAVELAGKHQRSVTAGTQLGVGIHLDASHLDDGTGHSLHIIGNREDVRLKRLLLAHLHSILHRVVHGASTRLVVPGL